MKNNYAEIQNKSIDEKLDIIDKIGEANDLTASNLEVLECLSQDENEEIRGKVAEILVISSTDESEKILIKLLRDKDELVRVNACDSLRMSNSIEILNLLKDRIKKDRSSLVRGYAALSIADIATRINCDTKELTNFLQNVIDKERVVWVKINIYKALYMLGNELYLNKLLNELKNKSYRNRCAVVNILGDIVKTENFKMISSALTDRLEIEKTIAVKSSIEELIQSFDVQKNTL